MLTGDSLFRVIAVPSAEDQDQSRLPALQQQEVTLSNTQPAQNRYKADLREMRFLLFEQFRLGDLLSQPPFEGWGPDEVKMVIDEAYKFSCEVLGPLNAIGDREGCRVEGGAVKTPTGFKEAWTKLYEAGWKTLSVPPEYGGQGRRTRCRSSWRSSSPAPIPRSPCTPASPTAPPR